MTRYELSELMSKGMLLLDGAMGTMMAGQNLEVHTPVDMLSVTNGDIIGKVHHDYIAAGADIVSTNTFNSNAVSLDNYGLHDYAKDINRKGVLIARKETEAESRRTGRRVFVAGSVGPSCVSLSKIKDVEKQNYLYKNLSEAFAEQMTVLIETGVDILLLETFYDIRNMYAALNGAMKAMHITKKETALIVSAAVSYDSGNLFSGHPLESFVQEAENCDAVACIGINCMEADKIISIVRKLQKQSSLPVSCHPNAGLPDKTGNYKISPVKFADTLDSLIKENPISIVGGCCGTTPQHIHALRQLINNRVCEEA